MAEDWSTLTPATDREVKIVGRKRSAQPKGEPHNPGDDRQQSDDGNKVRRDDVDNPLDGGTTRLTLAYDFDNVVQPANGDDGVSDV